MEISGLVKTSLIDYPGKVAAVVFTQGCNFRCGFCHNPELIPFGKGTISQESVLNFLKTRNKLLEAVVITGGEPILQNDLTEFIEPIKEQGYFVKLDSNGSNPNRLKKLIDQSLIDYVAMDIKGPLKDYSKITGNKNNKFVQKSIDILKNSPIEYEFRTTIVPYYHTISSIRLIGELIKGAPLFTLQNFRSAKTLDPKLSEEKSFSQQELLKMAKIMEQYVKKVVIHQNVD